MAKTSVRVEPVARGDVRNRGGHNSRKGSKAAHIDETRTCFNMTLYGGDDAVEDIYMDIEGVDNQRAGGPVCAEIVSSFPLALIGEKEGQKLTPELCSKCLASPVFQTWLDMTIEGMRRHGLIHADLHMDEDTPHIQAFLSIKTERKVGKRDRSGKSKTVLNYAHFWSIEGDKKTKDFYFAAGKVSDNPKKLARVEEKYGMKYDPSITPTGKLQTEFAELYQSAGLDMKRGESVLTTGVRHRSFHEKRAEDERKAVESKIADKNAKMLAEYKVQAEAKLAQDKAEIDRTTEQAKAKAEADLAVQVASAAAAARARAKADEDKAQAEAKAKEAEQARVKAEEEAQKEGREVVATVAWLKETHTRVVEQLSQRLEQVREQNKCAEIDLSQAQIIAVEAAQTLEKAKEERNNAKVAFEQAQEEAKNVKAQAEVIARETEQARIKAEANLAVQVASAAAAARARAKADEDKAQAEAKAKEAEQARLKAEAEAKKEGKEVAETVAWLKEAYTRGVEQLSQRLEQVREQNKRAEQDLAQAKALADEVKQTLKKTEKERDKAEADLAVQVASAAAAARARAKADEDKAQAEAKAKEAEQARIKAEEEAQKEVREVAATVAWLKDAHTRSVEQLSQRLEQVREQNKRAEQDLAQAKALADDAAQTLEKAKEERNNAKVAFEQAQEEAKKVKAQAESDVTAVKTYYESLKSLGKTLFGLTEVAGGVVAYLKQMREIADAKFRSAIWRRAQKLRYALAQAVRTTEMHEQVNGDYNDAATRFKLE